MFWLAVVSFVATLWFGITATEPTGFLQLDSIEARPPNFVSDKPLHLNITLVNRGAAPVFRVGFFPAIITVSDMHGTDAELAESAKEKFNAAEAKAHEGSKLNHQHGLEVGVGGIGISQDLEYVLSEDQAKGLATGSTRLYVMVWAQWDKHRAWGWWPEEMNQCIWMRPLNTTDNKIVWANCS